MRIAFVTDRYLDPRRQNSWSGLPFFIRRSLERSGIEVETCVLSEPRVAASMAVYAGWRFLRGRRYLRNRDERVLRNYAAQTTKLLRSLQVDAVFCPSSVPTAYLCSSIPTVFWTDACFAGMLDFYESFSNLAPRSVAAGHAAEQAALKNCARAVYSSDWAAKTARESYSADTSKIRVVPFGGNVMDRPTAAEVESLVRRREELRCELLLIGVDWHRKGADIAVEAARSLNERGLRTRLTVVGCKQPRSMLLPSFVEVIPFIDKATEEGSRRFNEICRRSHFMIMPSRADCTPVAIIEANYFGIPCLSTGVGGISSLVRDGVNGRLFGLAAGGTAYADYVLGLMREPFRYRSLAMGAAAFAGRQFTWEHSGARIAEILREVVNPVAPARGAAPLAVPSGL
jgi:glycosyltransferase involved in cell wall biosynthesis